MSHIYKLIIFYYFKILLNNPRDENTRSRVSTLFLGLVVMISACHGFRKQDRSRETGVVSLPTFEVPERSLTEEKRFPEGELSQSCSMYTC